VRLLGEFFPGKTYLYFPFLDAALVWIQKRVPEWEEKIVAWKVWPDPDYIAAKPDAFVLEFYRRHPELNHAFRKAVESEEREVLRAGFLRLYPIFGLEDPFLRGLFHDELAAGNLAAVVKEFDDRVCKAREDIKRIPDKSRLFRSLKACVEELLSMGVTVLSQTQVRSAITKWLEEKGCGNEG